MEEIAEKLEKTEKVEEYIQIIVWREKLPYMYLYPQSKFTNNKRKLLQRDVRGLDRNFLSCISEKSDRDNSDNYILGKDCEIPISRDGYAFDISKYKIVESYIVCEYC